MTNDQSCQFQIKSSYKPSGDQPKAIKTLTKGINDGLRSQVLLGITGSGKTFTMANIIQNVNRPTMIMAHNKTLAAQLYGEMKELFPNNAVEYFVSYYDYYQPEAYVARTDTFIEKDASINEQIDLLRHSATRSLLERRDTIVVSSVSCIFGIGSPETYSQMKIKFTLGQEYARQDILKDLVNLQYERNDVGFERGNFRVRGDNVDIFPSHYSNSAWRMIFFGNELEEIHEFDPLTGQKNKSLDTITVYANSHFVSSRKIIESAIISIKEELNQRVTYLESTGKLVEAQRLSSRTKYDLEMMMETNRCKGIENYSRFLTNRSSGEPPPTLFEYLPNDALLFVDESHVTVSQIQSMYYGDKSRKDNLVEHGFRLPSARDNRPLTFEEWQKFRPQTIFVSATPSEFEIQESNNAIVEQVIRPTGLLDPVCIIKPATNQVEDVLSELQLAISLNMRVLMTTLTKKMAEDLTNYLQGIGYKASYLHSEVLTLERIEIIQDLRKGNIDIIVGINLLREGLDIPECGLVVIFDADKEGFLRSKVSLIQTIGRAARNDQGRVILYADNITKSIQYAIDETKRRRELQIKYNKQNNITPKTINRKIHDIINSVQQDSTKNISKEMHVLLKNPSKLKKYVEKLKKEMHVAANNLEFEDAAKIRDQIELVEQNMLKI